MSRHQNNKSQQGTPLSTRRFVAIREVLFRLEKAGVDLPSGSLVDGGLVVPQFGTNDVVHNVTILGLQPDGSEHSGQTTSRRLSKEDGKEAGLFCFAEQVAASAGADLGELKKVRNVIENDGVFPKADRIKLVRALDTFVAKVLAYRREAQVTETPGEGLEWLAAPSQRCEQAEEACERAEELVVEAGGARAQDFAKAKGLDSAGLVKQLLKSVLPVAYGKLYGKGSRASQADWAKERSFREEAACLLGDEGKRLNPGLKRSELACATLHTGVMLLEQFVPQPDQVPGLEKLREVDAEQARALVFGPPVTAE